MAAKTDMALRAFRRDVALAARLIQDMTAQLLDDPTCRYEALSLESQNEVMSRVISYAVLSKEITSPTKLHQHNAGLMIQRGWTLDSIFNAQFKRTPLICPFENLPVFVQTFVECCFSVLKTLLYSHRLTAIHYAKAR